MTLVSVVVVLTIKSYTLEAQDKVVNDVDVERMASCKLINHADTLRHEKMINRFVKMTFDSKCVNAFKELFDEHKKAIRNSPGCLHLELLNDIDFIQVHKSFAVSKSI